MMNSCLIQSAPLLKWSSLNDQDDGNLGQNKMRNKTNLPPDPSEYWINSQEIQNAPFFLSLKWLFAFFRFHCVSPLKRTEENSLLPTFNDFTAQSAQLLLLYLQNRVKIPFLEYSFQLFDVLVKREDLFCSCYDPLFSCFIS